MATKKTTTKTKVKASPKKATKVLVDAPEGAEFWINYGSIVKNLKELSEALKGMNEKTFQHHVNKGKNDFAVWISTTLGEKELAKKVQKAKTPAGISKVINEFLK